MVLDRSSVTFAGAAWPGVLGVTVRRWADRVAEARGESSPHAAFVDAVERRVDVEVRCAETDAGALAVELGAEGVLVFERSRGGTDAGRERVSVRGVVVEDLRADEASGRSGGTRRTVRLRGVSASGADPVSVERVGLGG